MIWRIRLFPRFALTGYVVFAGFPVGGYVFSRPFLWQGTYLPALSIGRLRIFALFSSVFTICLFIRASSSDWIIELLAGSSHSACEKVLSGMSGMQNSCNFDYFLCYPLLTAFPKAAPLILEPIMAVEVNIPQEFQLSCFSMFFCIAFCISLFSPLVAREVHGLHACKGYSARTTSGEINLLTYLF